MAPARRSRIESAIDRYLAGLPDTKRAAVEMLHRRVLDTFPGCRLWFEDGTDGDGKTVANPSIGYGAYTINYADGSTKEFYRTGLSANSSGFSVYVLGLDDKTYLARTFGDTIGKATVTGYCIKFRKVEDIDVDVLVAAIRHGMETADS